jgi:hypothetical protein
MNTDQKIKVKWEYWPEGREAGWLFRTKTFPWTQEGWDAAEEFSKQIRLNPKLRIRRLRIMQPKPYKYGPKVRQ